MKLHKDAIQTQYGVRLSLLVQMIQHLNGMIMNIGKNLNQLNHL